MIYNGPSADASEFELRAYVSLLMDMTREISDVRFWLILVQEAQRASSLIRSRSHSGVAPQGRTGKR